MSSLPLPIAAFIAGLVSFLSPCVLPLVPGYVSLISGASVEELQSKDRKLLNTVLLHSIMFILGFTLVFVCLGAAATSIGHFMKIYKKQLSWVAGTVIVILGLHLTGILKIKALYADKRLHAAGGGKSPIAAFVAGFAFAFGWTPCIGPILAVILTLAGSADSVQRGIVLLFVYSLGLAVPFLLTSIGINGFLSFYGKFRRHLQKVEIGSGVLLILCGVLIFTRHFTLLSSYLGFLNRWFTL
ncbi:MAG TPA: cytochrome c biogenesis protein CcdA [Candidatus Angelobacter sp.]|nr:cytochrome c biogenesis protein CcdA [Candidatus Angelobacter sp.]